MQITVFGASGRVGQLVIKQLLKNDYQVVAFVHSKDPFQPQPALTVIKGSITDDELVKQAITGSAAVISTLGSWKTKSKDIVSTGTRHIIIAMDQATIARLITLTGTGAYATGDKLNIFDRASHLLLRIIAPKILADGEAHIKFLEQSRLDWTCLRSPVMTSAKTASYSLDRKLGSLLATIPRSTVAVALVEQLSDQKYIRQAPIIHKR